MSITVSAFGMPAPVVCGFEGAYWRIWLSSLRRRELASRTGSVRTWICRNENENRGCFRLTRLLAYNPVNSLFGYDTQIRFSLNRPPNLDKVQGADMTSVRGQTRRD